MINNFFGYLTNDMTETENYNDVGSTDNLPRSNQGLSTIMRIIDFARTMYNMMQILKVIG